MQTVVVAMVYESLHVYNKTIWPLRKDGFGQLKI